MTVNPPGLTKGRWVAGRRIVIVLSAPLGAPICASAGNAHTRSMGARMRRSGSDRPRGFHLRMEVEIRPKVDARPVLETYDRSRTANGR